MRICVLSTLLFAASAFSLPTEPNNAVVARVATSKSILAILGFNTTTKCDANGKIPATGLIALNLDTWKNQGSYTSYYLGRDLASNETLNLYSTSGGNLCGTYLYSVPASTSSGCYQTGPNETFSCMIMGTPE